MTCSPVSYWVERFEDQPVWLQRRRTHPGRPRVVASTWGFDSVTGRRCRTDRTVCFPHTWAEALGVASRLRLANRPRVIGGDS